MGGKKINVGKRVQVKLGFRFHPARCALKVRSEKGMGEGEERLKNSVRSSAVANAHEEDRFTPCAVLVF